MFPDDCRVCGVALSNISRIPVCPACLHSPQPLTAEFFCSVCHTPFETPYPLDDRGLCGLCRKGYSGFDAAYSFGPYDGTLRELIRLFKYEPIPTLAAPLGKLMASALPRDRVFDAVIPMPLHWTRRWRRGFNQSHLLARELARHLHVPILDAVRRRRATSTQAGLSAHQRRRNVAGAFEPARWPFRQSVKGLHVLLVDDVFTTGATVSACSSALKRAGASSVSVLTLARADRRTAAVVPASDQSFALSAASGEI